MTVSVRQRSGLAAISTSVSSPHLRDGHAAVLVAPLHVEHGRLAVQPQARHVQARAQQPARVVAHVCTRHARTMKLSLGLMSLQGSEAHQHD